MWRGAVGIGWLLRVLRVLRCMISRFSSFYFSLVDVEIEIALQRYQNGPSIQSVSPSRCLGPQISTLTQQASIDLKKA